MPGATQSSAAPQSPCKMERDNDPDLERKSLPKDIQNSSPVAKVLFYCGLNAIVSAGLIAFNKYLMHKGRFPYPGHLVAIHTSASTLFVSIFFLLHRGCSVESGGYFSALPTALADSSIIGKAFALGSLFSLQLVFSNAAYLYSSVVFIQMMKEGNLPLVYFLSVIAALEIVHWQRIRVLFVIVFATLMTIKGEFNFTWLGFTVQLTGQCFEVFRIVLQAILLNGRGLNLDVMTYILLVMPASVVMLFGVLGVNSAFEVIPLPGPTWSKILEWLPMLILNALIAVALNFTTALTVKHASGVGFVLSGLIKDSAIVMLGACILGEPISNLQVVGFSMQMAAIFAYSMIKLYPDRFSNGIHLGFKCLLTREATTTDASIGDKKKEMYYGAADAKNSYVS